MPSGLLTALGKLIDFDALKLGVNMNSSGSSSSDPESATLNGSRLSLLILGGAELGLADDPRSSFKTLLDAFLVIASETVRRR
mmetsp:Transcript_99686/g.176893  ORF Transcript_99686/g.176893 Transcript_99686/m.176893 type:complete len:83 (-) Transcript_99686:721-969(-)